MNDIRDYGISVDLGTSQITIHLVDIQTHNVICERIYENPQNSAGHDVITRIKFGMKSESNSKKLTSSIRERVHLGITETIKSSKITIDQVNSIVVVGNTAIHHFFFELPYDSLLKPPYNTTGIESINTTTNELGLKLGKALPIYSPPLVQSFVGADAVAMILLSGLLNHSNPSMAIDIGTNTEIVLWDNEQLRICSAASGPAFEGMSLDCGCLADEGAIDNVKITGTEYRPVIHVIGNSRPKGICGTGAISIISSMLENGIIDSKGSIVSGIESPWISKSGNVMSYLLTHPIHSQTGRPIYLSQVDLRMLQKSKAAIRGGIDYLLYYASCEPNQLEHIYLTGAFGSRLDLNDAFRIGLFPYFSNAEIFQDEHGASKGADLFLINPSIKTNAETIANKIKYIELIDNPKFNEFYVQSQMFEDLF